jgi:2-polyprenyl-6-methoxyphenol hydroxylase-like FAD-dependent oxidoreductase
MMNSDVLIIGAGPTGLVLALWLTKLGFKVRIVDKTAEPGRRGPRIARLSRSHIDRVPRRGTCHSSGQ